MIPYIQLSSGCSKKISFKLMINSPGKERKLNSSSFVDIKNNDKWNEDGKKLTITHSCRYRPQMAGTKRSLLLR